MASQFQILSVQYFWDVIHHSLERALSSYARSRGRGTAMVQNHESSAALVLLIVTLDAFVGRIILFSKAGRSWSAARKAMNSPLYERIKVLLKNCSALSDDRKRKLVRNVIEVTVCRDFIVHAYIWTGTTDTNNPPRKWRISPVMKPRDKAKAVMTGRCSKTLRLNLVPTRVGVTDIVKALIVAVRVMTALGELSGAVLGNIPPEAAIALQSRSEPAETFDHWIASLLRRLYSKDRADLVKTFSLKTVSVDGATDFVGIS